MASTTSSSKYWKYLIRSDKSATSQFEDFCLGLAKIIRGLEPGPDAELTPQRLAAFYRSVGGNYDSLFLKTSDHALSFMYRTLGCFHSLQPTTSPFETPSVPCLTHNGFARWQTIQLLLSPEDNVPFLQKAAQCYDVPRPDGGYFPKNIPADCFPNRPDEEMERWYKHVTGQLNQENHVRRIKYSPYQSPHPEPQDRRDSYFPNGKSGRPGKPGRTGSQDEEQQQERVMAYRRRSSVPEAISPLPVGIERGSHWDPATRQQRKARSHSSQRAAAGYPIRPRSNTGSGAHPPQSPSLRISHPPASPYNQHARRHPSNEHPNSRPSSQQYSHNRNRSGGAGPKSPSPVDEGTGSEASSEGSHGGRRSRNRKSDEDRQNRKNSLWPPSFLKSHKRRHSSDASYRNSISNTPPQPLRPEYYPPKSKKSHGLPPAVQSPQRPVANIRFNDHIFERSPMSLSPDRPLDPRAPTIRYPDQSPSNSWPPQHMDGVPIIGQPLSREGSSESNTDRRYPSDLDRQAQRKAGAPLRVSTVSGVGGRQYASMESRTTTDRQRGQIRGSLPTAV